MKNLLPSTMHPGTEIQTSLEGLCQGILLEIHPLGYWKSLFTVLSDQGPALTTCLRGSLLTDLYYSCWMGGGLPWGGGGGAGRGSSRPFCRGLMLEKLPVLKKLGRYGGTLDSEELANLIHWRRNKTFFPQCLSSALYWESLTSCQLQGENI